LKGTFYILSGKIAHDRRDDYMNTQQVIDIFDHDHEIGGHTVTHPDLTQLSKVQAATEIFKAKSDLEALISAEVRTFAYPFSAYNDEVVEIVKQAGYKSARTGDNGLNTVSTDPYRLLPIGPTSDTPLESLITQIEQAQKAALWLIIGFHHINYSGVMYSNTLDYLGQVASYIKRRKIRAVTVSEGLRESVALSDGL
jgi:peptidoglycan/xylan/chitin deacetylase (PgdA/CDA1 family)